MNNQNSGLSLTDLIQIIVYAVIAILGTLARELKAVDIAHLTLIKTCSNIVVSIFGATMVYFIASMANLPPQLGYVLAGLVGWGGPQVIDRLFEKTAQEYLSDGKKKKSQEEKKK